jgi:endonuclease/exonuclease/phosphatase (EEP) superfamily protein YafD
LRQRCVKTLRTPDCNDDDSFSVQRRDINAGCRRITRSAPSYLGVKTSSTCRASQGSVLARRWRNGASTWLSLMAAIPLLCSCFTLTTEPRALVAQADGAIRALTLPCPPELPRSRAATAGEAFDPQSIRLATWNIHKEGDAGWQKDLAGLSAGNDLVLLQEVSLAPDLRNVLDAAGFRWVMASSFEYDGNDVGVLTASRVPPLANCTQRVVEPLLRLPKSAVVSWFALAGEARAIAIVNVHAINFSLSIEAYRSQFRSLQDTLAAHDGPIVVAGDFNTWSDARRAAVDEFAAALGLAEAAFRDDRRTLFFGNQLDHVLVRGLRVVAAAGIDVTSSDHNPVTVILQRSGP